MTTTTKQEIRFDDLPALKGRVGEEFSPWGRQVQVTQEMIDRFAEVTGDRQWIHIDVERARRESPFGGPIAHGFLVLSLLPVLREREDLAIVGYGNVVNYGADRLRFMSPVPAGSVVRARARIVAVEQKPKGTLVSEEIQVGVLGAETPALSYVMVVLYQAPRGR
jgi:hypothetical protein